MGNWIINGEKHPVTLTGKLFCHNGKDDSCFDKYCNFCRKIKIDAELANINTFQTDRWKSRTPYKELIEKFINKK